MLAYIYMYKRIRIRVIHVTGVSSNVDLSDAKKGGGSNRNVPRANKFKAPFSEFPRLEESVLKAMVRAP